MNDIKALTLYIYHHNIPGQTEYKYYNKCKKSFISIFITMNVYSHLHKKSKLSFSNQNFYIMSRKKYWKLANDLHL